MKTISLTKGYFTDVDDDVFEWASAYKWFYSNGYAVRMGKQSDGIRCRKFIYLHKEILTYKEGSMHNEAEGDHIDRNRLNNLYSNLRWCTSRQNSCNIALIVGVSRFKGVRKGKTKGTWDTCVSTKDGVKYVGRFRSEEDAAKAYDIVAIEEQGDFAYLNFPTNKVEYLARVAELKIIKEKQLKNLNDNILKLLELMSDERN